MIEILLYVIYASLVGGAGAVLVLSIKLFSAVSRSRPSIRPELRDEIEQNAAWWDREFHRLLVSIGERSEYSVSYLRDVQLRAGIAADGVYGPVTRRSLSASRTCGFEWESMGRSRRCGGYVGHLGDHRDIHDPRSWVAVGAESIVRRSVGLDNPCPYDRLSL